MPSDRNLLDLLTREGVLMSVSVRYCGAGRTTHAVRPVWPSAGPEKSTQSNRIFHFTPPEKTATLCQVNGRVTAMAQEPVPHRTYKMKTVSILVTVLALAIQTAGAGSRMVPALFATESHVVRFDKTGKKAWQVESGVSRDVWRLPDGNVLFPCNFKPGVEGGVREVNQEGKVVWEFRTNGWVLCCQRLRDGNTLIGAAGQCALLVVDPAGKVVNAIRVKMQQPHKHAITMARQLDNGNFLVVEEQLGLIREYRPTGEVAWEVKAPFRPFAAVRVKSGNTFISGQDGIAEVTVDKDIVWLLTKEDVVEMGPRWFAGFQIRANGNIVICNAGGKVPFFEVNRDKKVTWQSSLPLKESGIGHGLFLLDEVPPFLR